MKKTLIMSALSLSLSLCLGSAWAAAPQKAPAQPATAAAVKGDAATPVAGGPTGMQATLSQIQDQIGAVQKTMSGQMQKQNLLNQKQLAAFHQEVQAQLSSIQEQVQQVQANQDNQIKQLQDEINQLEHMR